MKKKEKLRFKLEPISKEELDAIPRRSGRSIYVPYVEKFLANNDDIAEFVPLQNVKTKTVYQALKHYAERVNFAFLVRQRQGRIFLLKSSQKET